MSKFTQGNWVVYEREYVPEPENIRLTASTSLIQTNRGEDIALVRNEADARAIKAVPEMYRALEELIPILEGDGRLSIAYSIKRLLERIDGEEAKS